jgi:magnesium chelatase family protein
MLAAAMNPCPCGYFGDPEHTCSCGDFGIEKYFSRISGPLLDRIDIHVDVPAVPYRDLSDDRSGEASAFIRERVSSARNRQLERFAGRDGVFANAHMGPRDIKKFCGVSSEAEALLQSAILRLKLSARAYHRILKISRTIADLDKTAHIAAKHVSEAVQYRNLDRQIG